MHFNPNVPLPQVKADLAALCVFADVLGVIRVVLWVGDLGVHPWSLVVGVVNLPAMLKFVEVSVGKCVSG